MPSSSAANSIQGSPRRRQQRARTASTSGAESLYTVDTSCDSDGHREINTSSRLEKLRLEMAKHELGVYIVPSEDAHQSEYTSPADERRAFISGFSGSAGVAVITRDVTCMNQTPEGLAALSTDGRYFTQASNELDFNWSLLRQGVVGDLTWQQFAIENAIQMSLDSGDVVKIGVDPTLFTFEQIKALERQIDNYLQKAQNDKAQVKLIAVKENLIDAIWNLFEEAPQREYKPVMKLDVKYTGEETGSKLKRLQAQYFDKFGSNTLILNALDEIAWVLNLRGDDIEYNPLFYSYLIIEDGKKLTLYTDAHERFNNLKDYLKEINCTLKNYNDIWSDIRRVASNLHAQSKELLLTEEASWKMVNGIIAKNYQIVSSPIRDLKEVKNTVELEGQKLAQVKDGLALIQYFSWLEDQLVNESELITEYEAGEKLLEFRSKLDNFKGLSFETISSTGPNAAIIHYAPKPTLSAVINPNKIYLCDSGSQFLEGTTDTTRTLHFGTPTEEEIDNYTLVLKGHVALATLKFPEGCSGFQIDAIARQFLWTAGLDYAHGTGHGVDTYGPVHSMGVGIGFRDYCKKFEIKPGHLISNEPGYYKPDCYGIRIESMIFAKVVDGVEFNGKKWLEFETVTRVPFCKKLINVSLLSEVEKKWIDGYHKLVWETYCDKLDKKSVAYNWLKKETSPL
ncbi:unnamed protein product [Ambrosiozyma monospora]|uniref:Unnamed protein product n=1 Tax=Ambrosiozyma monospora TaxID=43982 RepID=A0ACB5SWQ4_AMBMO|nr:unnamed protein product [Ambrosiozyma monospora]